MSEMLIGAVAQGILNSIGLPQLLMLAGGGTLAWRLIRDASKPKLLLALLAGGLIAGWYLWPRNAGKPRTPRETGATPPRPVSQPRPGKPVQEAPRPTAYADIHAPAIKRLSIERAEKVAKDPTYPDPKIREERHQARLAKEAERKRKAALAATEEERSGFASVPPAPPRRVYAMTPDQARAQRLDMQEQRIGQARALADRIRQRYAGEQPPLIGGMENRGIYR